MTRITKRASVLVLALLSDCATVSMRQTSKTTLEFFQDGLTTKDAIVRQLGEPFSTLMERRVLIYRVSKTRDGYAVLERMPDAGALVLMEPGSWLPGGITGLFQLVLLFDARDILQQHALEPINFPRLTSPTELTFLVDGVTAKAETLLHLGAPTNVLREETILTYRLLKTSKGDFVMDRLGYGVTGLDAWLLAGEQQPFHFVLQFDDHEVLQKQAMRPICRPFLTNTTDLAFLLDGVTTKEAVFLQLGGPARVLEREMVLTYRLGKTSGGYCVLEKLQIESVPVGPGTWLLGGLEGEFDLVMTFDM